MDGMAIRILENRPIIPRKYLLEIGHPAALKASISKAITKSPVHDTVLAPYLYHVQTRGLRAPKKSSRRIGAHSTCSNSKDIQNHSKNTIYMRTNYVNS